MLEIVKLERWHIELLLSLGKLNADHYSDHVICTILANEAYTAIVDGEVLGCAGVLPYHSGHAECWSIITDELRSKPKTLLRVSRDILNRLCNSYTRIQSSCIEERSYYNFLEHLGFVYEGCMLM